MKHAIDTLQAEDDRLTAEITDRTHRGKPKTWRDSEWAMTMGALKGKRQEVFEALQILRKVGKQ